MRLSPLFSVATFLVAAHAQTLTHPPIPNGISQFQDFDGDLEALLASSGGASWTISPWTNTTIIPQACFRQAYDMGVSRLDIDVADIKYPDCAKAWTVCRVNNVTVSWDTIAKKLGGIPVGMRQYTSNVLVVPDSTGACGLASINGLIIVSEGCTTNRVLVHEFAHEMDTFALDELDQGYRYSLTKRWEYAYLNDTHMITPYAQTNQLENFAEVAAFAIMDGLVNGGVGRYIDNSQKALVDDQLKDWIATARPDVWAGNCDSKLEPTRAVFKANGNIAVGSGYGGNARIAQSGSELLCSGLQF